jgi:tetratricopeptide (TPR) repeat protein
MTERGEEVPRPEPEKHLSFTVLERLMPPSGSGDAERLAHILRCERCSEAALMILELPPAHGPKPDYAAVFARVEEGARRTLLWLAERWASASRFVEQVSDLPEGERLERIQTLARAEPWAVTTAFLEVAREEGRTNPERAAELARWAAVAAEQMDPERAPPGKRAGLLGQSECLLGDAFRRGADPTRAEEAFARAAAHLAQTSEAELHAGYCLLLSRLRRDQGRMEEAVALLHRARTLYDVAGDVVDAEEAYQEARALDPLAGEKR